jgi:segregation and condensation protein B
MTNEERKAALEAIIYAADEPATLDQLVSAIGDDKLAVQSSIDELVASFAAEAHGIEIREVAGGYKLYTKPQQHDVVRRFIKSLRPPLRLTMPALETLAVISYKQPVTAPEIAEIRGVNTSGVLKTLLDKRLITTAGRKEVIGRPILYRTSKEFLMRFGLSDLQELPSLKEFEALAREALGTDEGVAIPDELPTDVHDEVLDAPENTAGTPIADIGLAESHQTESASAPQSESAELAAAESITGELPDIEAILFDDEEAPAEVRATGEGMPAGELDDTQPKDAEEVQHPEAFDAEQLHEHATANSEETPTKPDEAKGAAAGE